MLGLGGESAVAVQGQPHHKGQAAPLLHQWFELLEVLMETAPLQGRQRGHAQPQRITTGQADPAPAHIKRQNRARLGRLLQRQGMAPGTGRPGCSCPTKRSKVRLASSLTAGLS